MTRDEVIEVASRALLTPFSHQGRALGQAMDCAGLYIYVCKELGVPYIDTLAYPKGPFDNTLRKEMDRQPGLEIIPSREALKGDILIMRIKSAPQHVAFHAGNHKGRDLMIHASEESGEVCIHGMDETWIRRVLIAYRFKGIQ